MAGIEVDPERIDAAGRALAADGDDLLDQLDRFEAGVAAYDGAWGDDMIGAYIGAAYTAIADWALTCWTTAAEEFTAAGEDLVGMAGAYRQVEDDNAKHLAGYYPPAG